MTDLFYCSSYKVKLLVSLLNTVLKAVGYLREVLFQLGLLSMGLVPGRSLAGLHILVWVIKANSA